MSNATTQQPPDSSGESTAPTVHRLTFIAADGSLSISATGSSAADCLTSLNVQLWDRIPVLLNAEFYADVAATVIEAITSASGIGLYEDAADSDGNFRVEYNWPAPEALRTAQELLLQTSGDITNARQWLMSSEPVATRIEKAIYWLDKSRAERKAANEAFRRSRGEEIVS